MTLTTKTNETPSFINLHSHIQLNSIKGIGIEVHVFEAMDSNSDPLYFKIKGKDSEKFMINQNTGKLVNRKYLVRDHQYKISVEVSDGMDKSEIQVTINT